MTSSEVKDEECYSKGRMHQYLMDHSSTYKDLQDEQVKGWNSSALDWWYTRHMPKPRIGDKRERDATTSGNSTVFKTNTVELCERYRAHASRILPVANPAIFKAQLTQRGRNLGIRPPVVPLEPRKPTGQLFLDLGCAPGGVSAFLTQNCAWEGVGVTLSVEQGGIELPPWTHTSSQHFVPVLDSILSESLDSKVSDALAVLHHPVMKGGVFDFVNGGAVADFGQQPAGEISPLELEFERAFFKKPVSHPKHLFLFAQLLIALRWVKQGGCVMLVVGLGEVGSLMMLLHHLQPMFGTGTTVQLLETMHMMKPPVYVLISNIYPTDESVAALRNEIASQSNPDYWLGTSDEAFEIAKKAWDLKLGRGGQSMGEQIERFWVKKRALLEERRATAEGQYSKRTPSA